MMPTTFWSWTPAAPPQVLYLAGQLLSRCLFFPVDLLLYSLQSRLRVVSTACAGAPPVLGKTRRYRRANAQITSRWDVGALILIGPSPLHQDFTCVSGQPCGLHLLGGLLLSSSDMVMIHDTCGGTSFASPLLASVGWDGLFFKSLGATSTRNDVPANATNVPILEVAGGQYRLCWCSSLAAGSSPPCVSAAEYVVNFGKLDVIGPFPLQQERTCVGGQTCEFPIQVWHGSGQDSLLLLDTCGVDSSIPKVQTTRGHCGRASIVGTVPLQDFMVIVETSTSSASECRALCNAHADMFSNTSCVAAMFKDSQSNVSIPPDTRGVGSCQLYSICSLVSDEASDYVVLTLQQTGMSQNLPLPSLLQLGNTSLPSSGSQTAIVAWGELVLTTAGGTFRMCWCAGGQMCRTPSEFGVDMGPFTLVGPLPLGTSRTCSDGSTCVVDGLSGVGLLDGDRLLLQDTCGSTAWGGAQLQQLQFLPVNTTTTDTTMSRTAVSFSNGSSQVLALRGGQYRLCWCAANFLCTSGVDVGELVVRGPAANQHRTCMAGQICEIQALLGRGLGVHDSLLVLETCSEPW